MGPLKLDAALQPGQWRNCTPQEIEALKNHKKAEKVKRTGGKIPVLFLYSANQLLKFCPNPISFVAAKWNWLNARTSARALFLHRPERGREIPSRNVHKSLCDPSAGTAF